MSSALIGRVQRYFEALSALCLLALMLVVLVDVAGRSLFNRPLPWGTEVLEIVLAAMVFLLYPVLALRSSHITVDLVAVTPAVQRLQRALSALVGASLFGLIAWCLAKQAFRAAGYGESTPLLGVPLWYILGAMSLLALVSALAFVLSPSQSASQSTSQSTSLKASG
jgi:TRAP-type transport system small permease protein